MKKKTKILIYAITFVLVFIISALVRIKLLGSVPARLLEVQWNADSGMICKDLPYPNENGNTFDLYIPAGLDPEQEQHLILFIHGGSFNSGSKDDGEIYCKFYASHGYIAASVDYTLQTQGLDATIDVMNREILQAVDSIGQITENIGYHITGMAPFGVSAGGTLAMNLAYNGQSSIPVKFVFQLAAPTYFHPDDWGLLMQVDHLTSKEDFLYMMTGERLTLENWQDAVDRISPASCVRDGAVPSLIGYGLIDHCVPLNQKYYLMDAYERYGVAYQYIEFPHSNHGMYNDLDKLQEFIALSLEYAQDLLD